MNHPTSKSNPNPSDPLLKSSLAEMKWIVGVWAITFCWVIGYGMSQGYAVNDSIETVMGMPSWVVWGVVVPWGFSTVFTTWFAFCKMTDHSFDQEAASESKSPNE